MLALTIPQPWAELIVRGVADFCRRERPLPFRGKIAIHARAKGDWDEWDAAERAARRAGLGGLPFQKEELEYGVILGTAELVKSVRQAQSAWFRGPVGLQFTRPRRAPRYVAVRGDAGLWELTDYEALRALGVLL